MPTARLHWVTEFVENKVKRRSGRSVGCTNAVRHEQPLEFIQCGKDTREIRGELNRLETRVESIGVPARQVFRDLGHTAQPMTSRRSDSKFQFD